MAASFPQIRMRRLRRHEWTRRLVAETVLSPADFIWPLFVIEGEKPFIADQGDVVYAPANRWHLPEASGEGLSCRLAMTPFPAGNHFYQPKDGKTGQSQGR